MRLSHLSRSAAVALVVAATSLVGVTAGSATPGDAGVPDLPRLDTPYVVNGAVWDADLAGGIGVVVGDFTRVREDGPAGALHEQSYFMAFDYDTGMLRTDLMPQFNGPIYEVEASEDGTAVYVGGTFTDVDGTTRNRLARINLADGSVDATFAPSVSAKVDGLAVGNGKVYLGGDFQMINGASRSLLGAVDAVTGWTDSSFDLPVTGPIAKGGAGTVRAVDLSPDGSTLLSVHNSRFVDGQDRAGVALIDLTGPTAEVSPWFTSLYRDNYSRCSGGALALRDGEFSPDGSYFATVGRGNDRPPVCDSTIALPTTADADGDTDPNWITRHHDSVYSIAISPDAVFVGGHFFDVEEPGYGDPEPWVPGNPNTIYDCANQCAYETLAPEVGRRDQLAALNPVDGKAFSWDPISNAFKAVSALTWTSEGLFVGQDRDRLGGFEVGRFGVYAVDDLPVEDNEIPVATIDVPAAGGILAAGPLTFSGDATDDVGVDEVRVGIRDNASNQWLDAATGQFGPWTTNLATLDVPGGPAVGWTLDVTLPDGDFLMTTFAVDQANKVSATVYSGFTTTSGPIDQAPPSVTTSVPAPAEAFPAGALAISGTATDDVEVVTVTLALKDKANNFWFDVASQTFVAGYRTFPATLDAAGTPSTGWSANVAVPAGSFTLTSFAIDGVGNESARVYRSFTAFSGQQDTTAPTVALTNPVPQSTIAGPTITVDGSADDNIGVASVQVAIRRNADNLWWNASTQTWGGFTTFNATLATPGGTSTTFATTGQAAPAGTYLVQVRSVDASANQSAWKYSSVTVS